MAIYMWPYKKGSKGCRALATALGARILRLTNSKFIPRRQHTVINWGNSGEIPFNYRQIGRVINHSRNVYSASNKLRFFDVMRENALTHLLPDHAFDRQGALVLLSNMERPKIYCRHKLTGHSGEGIAVCTTEEEVKNAQLYTANLGWRQEYRVHVAFGRVIDFQKKCRLSTEQLEARNVVVDMDIRNLKGGWIYAREGRVLPTSAEQVCIDTINAVGLDFGAVDVCVLRDGSIKVLEVNTACGLEGSTVEAYSRAFQEELFPPDIQED
jgi:hypothetical protein